MNINPNVYFNFKQAAADLRTSKITQSDINYLRDLLDKIIEKWYRNEIHYLQNFLSSLPSSIC